MYKAIGLASVAAASKLGLHVEDDEPGDEPSSGDDEGAPPHDADVHIARSKSPAQRKPAVRGSESGSSAGRNTEQHADKQMEPECCLCCSGPIGKAQVMRGGWWLCAACQFYGNEPMGSANNLARATWLAAQTKNASSSGSGSSAATAGAPPHHSGQSNTRLTRGAAWTRRCAQELASAPAVGDYPVFDDIDVDRATKVIEALTAQRAALGAKNFMPPPRELQELIQRGGLIDLTLTLPMSVDEAAKPAPSAELKVGPQMQIHFEDGELSTSSAGGLTRQQFADAILTVILPCLAGQPQARSHWSSLYSTAVKLEEWHGWEAARTYVNALLTDRVRHRLGYATPDDDLLRMHRHSNALQSPQPHWAAAAAGRPSPFVAPMHRNSMPIPQRLGARGSSISSVASSVGHETRNTVCMNFNKGTCSGERCVYQRKHVCSTCNALGHSAMMCKSGRNSAPSAAAAK